MRHELKSLIEEFCADHEHWFRDPVKAGGHCFSMSMAFARDACGYGMQPQLVRWDAIGDEEYRDHWAVLLDSETVIDFTRSQIDDTPGVIHRIDSYPATLSGLKTYPAEFLLGVFDPAKHHGDDIPAQVIRKLDFERAMFDANRVPARPAPAWQYAVIVVGLSLFFWQVICNL